MSKNIEKVFVTYEEMFCDELDVEVLYKNKGNINGYESEKGEVLTKKEVMDWVMENYYNRRVYVEWCNNNILYNLEDEVQLYVHSTEYRKLVDAERLYILYLMGVEITKIAEIFGISRPTVYSKIKTYEAKFLRK